MNYNKNLYLKNINKTAGLVLLN